MKKSVGVVLATFVLALFASAVHAQSPAIGSWDLTTISPEGEFKSTLVVREEGGQLKAVGKSPQDYGVTLLSLPALAPNTAFAKNDIGFIDPTGVDHDALGVALKKALYNYMHGIGLDEDVRRWFDVPVPRPKVHRQRIARALAAQQASSVVA